MSKFERVKHYYEAGLWNETMVRNAIGKWITQEEADLILNPPVFEENSEE